MSHISNLLPQPVNYIYFFVLIEAYYEESLQRKHDSISLAWNVYLNLETNGSSFSPCLVLIVGTFYKTLAAQVL